MSNTSLPPQRPNQPVAGFIPNPKLKFMEQCREVMRFRRLALRLGCPFAILHVEAADAVLRERIAQRAAAGADASEATSGVLEQQKAAQDPLTEDELKNSEVFSTDSRDSGEIARRAHV